MPTATIEVDTLFSSDPELRCDIYAPKGGSAPGVAILLHGGGWRMGSRGAMVDAATDIALRGWFAVAPQYRLLDEAPWPAQIEDVKRAILWVRASRDRFGDACDRIALVGYSAGGHLALLAAGTGGTASLPVPGTNPEDAERPDAVVSFFAVTRVEGFDAKVLEAGTEGARVASPIEHISEQFPPTLLFHGTADAMVSHEVTLELFAALEARGVPAELRLYSGMTHEFQRLPEIRELVSDDIVNFLDRRFRHGAGFEEALEERRAFWAERAAERAQ